MNQETCLQAPLWRYHHLVIGMLGGGEYWCEGQFEFPEQAQGSKDTCCSTLDQCFDLLHVARQLVYNDGTDNMRQI